MEYIEGRSLRDLLREEGRLSPARTRHLAVQILKGLAEAHAHGVVHRDLKPSNVMLTALHGEPEFVKVVDFGIAKALRPGEGSLLETTSGAILGTPMYLSPEQAAATEIDGRADLYSLGRNLLSNAFKFTESGEVRLTVGAEGSDWVSLAVSDTGPGIPASQRNDIFEAFQQADGTISRRYGGTGLGLTISESLAQLLGGSLALESVEGEGTTVTLTLPVKLGAQASQSKARREPTPPSSSLPTAVPAATIGEDYILIVEDDPTFAGVLRDLVREQGLECDVATTGEQALETARRRQPTGVLLDWGLPDLTGGQVLDELRAMYPTRRVPVHVISGADIEREARERGAVTVLKKPVSEESLISVVRALETDEARPRVLVVEDSESEQIAIEAFLQGVAADFASAATGADALALLEKERFACVIVDLGLPDMPGLELLERMPKSGAKVVVYTGRDLSEDDEVRVRRHTDSVIVKGVVPPERLLEDVKLFVRHVRRGPTGPHPALHPEESLSGRTILVVDDDIRNVFALSAGLESVGLNVEIARNGREGVECVASNPNIDLVLMDVMMPVMDGHEATRQIRQKLGRRDLPIIAVTAKAMKGDAERCLEAGADDYLPKPVDLERMLSVIRVWLTGRPRS